MAETRQSAELEDDSWLVPFLDVLLILVLILLPLVNPPKPDDAAKPPGVISVEIRWPDDCTEDIDLWVLAPKDKPVGYSRLRGEVFSLLRDDLGSRNDLSGLNYENAYTRGSPDGEYIVNVHLFNVGNCTPGIPVHYLVTYRDKDIQRRIDEGSVKLVAVSQELTLVRFTLQNNRIAPGSRHNLPKSIRHQP